MSQTNTPMGAERRAEIRKLNSAKKWGHGESAVQHVSELLDALEAAERRLEAAERDRDEVLLKIDSVRDWKAPDGTHLQIKDLDWFRKREK